VNPKILKNAGVFSCLVIIKIRGQKKKTKKTVYEKIPPLIDGENSNI